jgi:predicted enzyme related to lactoylglutathione lyase
MITGVHALIYSRDAAADRAFFRDVLGWAFVDAHEGWLIFALPPAELGVHPAEGGAAHELHLMCDDIEATRQALEEKGVAFARPIEDAGYGRASAIRLPGGGELGLYEPRHASPLASPGGAGRPKARKRKS